MNCGYKYVANVGEIESQTVSGTAVTITGKSMPTPTEVSVGGVKCNMPLTEATATSIKCTLASAPPAGQWNVNIMDANGSVPVKSGVAKVTISPTITSVTPNSNLNQLGGDEVTITGTGYDTVN